MLREKIWNFKDQFRSTNIRLTGVAEEEKETSKKKFF